MSNPPRLAWFHCFSGIAGDMAMGALIDAGADLDQLQEMLQLLPLDNWELQAQPSMRAGIACTDVKVLTNDDGSVHRTAAHISALIDEARLPERVRDRAQATFAALAQAEGKLHRQPPERVHFHEVGGIDAIIDVVGTCAALELLDIDQVWASAVAQGRGMVGSAHGRLPVPAPATVELLRFAPTYGTDIELELTTPTGAALLSALAVGWGPMPSMTIESSGFGAGDRELDRQPNLTQVIVGASAVALEPGQPVMLLETNVDDATGEALAHTIAQLLDAGAHDAWVTPIVMKKGRPAYTVSVLSDVALAGQLAQVLSDETGSLGVRGRPMERWPSARNQERVDVDGRSIRVKVGPGRVKVEFDDAARAARHLGRPVREVVSLAEEAFRRRGGADPNRGDDHPDPPTPHPSGQGPAPDDGPAYA